MASQDFPSSKTANPAERLIGGAYAVDLSREVVGGGGGLPAFVAERRGPGSSAMAVQTSPDAPPRAKALTALAGSTIAGLLNPVAAGPARGPDGHDAMFVICPDPPGPSLAVALSAPWSESDLLHCLLRPAAAALAALQTLAVTHRAIRIDNLFRAGPGEAVTLGCAWAAPPAQLQPALYEPPYSAMCLPAGRGEGSIADDVYALGVVMLVLALGHLPLAGLDETAIVNSKMELGSFKALVGRERLSPIVADLVAGMLAEDPEHRPPPTLLADPYMARTRRVAARPPRRAQRALVVAGREIWHARSLGHALAREADGGAAILRSGAIDAWLRRSLGEAPLAARVEEAVRQRQSDAPGDEAQADALLAMRAVVVLDPLAPLSWEGMSLWPDAIGAVLAGLSPDQPSVPGGDVAAKLVRLIKAEAAVFWAAARPERCDIGLLRLEMRQHRAMLRQTAWVGGLSRLRFALNPLLGCRSPRLGGAVVLRLADLLPALEAACRPEMRVELPIDLEIAAFIGARDDQRSDAALLELGANGGARAGTAGREAAALATLRLFASLQQRLGLQALPVLGGWLAQHLAPSTTTWRNRRRREGCAEALGRIAATGQLGALLAVLDDQHARTADIAGAKAAEDTVRRIDAELMAILSNAGAETASARRIGNELASGIGLAALGAMVIALMAG